LVRSSFSNTKTFTKSPQCIYVENKRQAKRNITFPGLRCQYVSTEEKKNKTLMLLNKRHYKVSEKGRVSTQKHELFVWCLLSVILWSNVTTPKTKQSDISFVLNNTWGFHVHSCFFFRRFVREKEIVPYFYSRAYK